MIRAFLFLLLTLEAHGSGLPVQSSAPLGLPTTVEDLYIPGSQVEVIPRKNNESSLVIRILEIKPAAEGFRYNLEIYALDPGKHHIADFLRRVEDEAPITGLDATFEATTIHPGDLLPKPQDPTPNPPSKLGGYRILLIILGILWALGLLAILFVRKKGRASDTRTTPSLTTAKKIQALVQQAVEGTLDDSDRAQLERLLLGHWKDKVPELHQLAPAEALVKLRENPEASPLVLKLEEWLHAPSPGFSESEITSLLAPYFAEPKT